jgi:hypothetical protein
MSTAIDAQSAESVIVVGEECIMADERRRHERLKVYLKVRWEGLLGFHDGELSDVSAGGCFILTEGQATLRELLRVEIQLHTGEWIRVWGEVTNCFAGVGFGVKFTEFDEEDQRRYALTMQQTRLIKSAVAALKRLDRSLVRRQGNTSELLLTDQKEYKARLLLALPQVNKTLLSLPECPKKTALRLSMHAYADASRLWGAVGTASSSPEAHSRALAEAYRCLKIKYEAPAEILDAMRRIDFAHVLNFLWQKGYIYLMFAS